MMQRFVSVAIFALAVFQLYMSTKVGVTPRGTAAREALLHGHISVGLLVLVLLLVRAYLARGRPRAARPERVPAAADALARHCCRAGYLTLLALCLTGPLYAWSEGHSVSLFGILSLPPLLDESYRAQVALGYFHSALGFWILMWAALCLVVMLWQWLRYRAAPQRMLPGFEWA
jgi:cytochrome b561